MKPAGLPGLCQRRNRRGRALGLVAAKHARSLFESGREWFATALGAAAVHIRLPKAAGGERRRQRGRAAKGLDAMAAQGRDALAASATQSPAGRSLIFKRIVVFS